MKNLRIAALFYLVMMVLTFIISAKVTKFESKEAYNKYKSNVVINYLG